MLRTDREGRAWFVTQPHHAEVAGYLAAHWGNAEFARLGHLAPAPDPGRLRAEAVLGIAQHDNGGGSGTPPRGSARPTGSRSTSPR